MNILKKMKKLFLKKLNQLNKNKNEFKENKNEFKENKNEFNENIKILINKLSTLNNELSTLKVQLNKLEIEVNLLAKEVNLLVKESNKLKDEIIKLEELKKNKKIFNNLRLNIIFIYNEYIKFIKRTPYLENKIKSLKINKENKIREFNLITGIISPEINGIRKKERNYRSVYSNNIESKRKKLINKKLEYDRVVIKSEIEEFFLLIKILMRNSVLPNEKKLLENKLKINNKLSNNNKLRIKKELLIHIKTRINELENKFKNRKNIRNLISEEKNKNYPKLFTNYLKYKCISEKKNISENEKSRIKELKNKYQNTSSYKPLPSKLPPKSSFKSSLKTSSKYSSIDS